MGQNDKIKQADIDSLKIIHYPDPRLREVCTPLDDPQDESVRALAAKMFEMMFAARGVGLAAPQVGVTVRLFVASPTLHDQDLRVYINPRIIEAADRQEAEEGCLSLPGVTCNIKRHNCVTIEATGLDGRQFQESGEQLLAKIFEHEMDHIDGRLISDRMGSVARLAHRRTLKQLEERFAKP